MLGCCWVCSGLVGGGFPSCWNNPGHAPHSCSTPAEHTLFKRFYVPFGGWLTFVISAGCFLAQDVRFCRLLCGSVGRAHTYKYTYIHTYTYIYLCIHKFIGLWFICRRSANEFWLPLSLSRWDERRVGVGVGVGASLHTHHRRRRLALDGGLICALLSPRLPLCCLITT